MRKACGRDVLAFCLSTAPDVNGARLLYGLEGLDDEDTARAMQQMASQEQVDDELPAHLCQINGGAVAGRVAGRFCVQTLDASKGEASVIADLYRRLADPNTRMLSYGGNSWLSALRCRALFNAVNAPDCRHLDLAELFSDGIAPAPPLQELLQLQALPCIRPGEAGSSEVQALQAYILYLSYQRAQAESGADDLAQGMREMRNYLSNETSGEQRAAFAALLKTWPS